MKNGIPKRITAIILALVMIVTSLTWDGIAAMAQEVSIQTESVDETEAASDESNATTEDETYLDDEADVISVEEEDVEYIDPEDVTPDDVIEDELTSNKTIYDLGGNKRMEIFHSNDVRYKNKKGDWVDYDPSLVPVEKETSLTGKTLEGYAYTNRRGDKKNYLPEKLEKDSPVRLEQDNYGIAFYPVTEEIDSNVFSTVEEFDSVTIEDDTYVDAYDQESTQPLNAVYEDILSGTTLEYQSSDIGIKESIILDSVPEQNSFVFEFELEGVTVRHNALDEGLTFYDAESGEMVAGMDAPNMNDATGEAYSEELVTTVEQKEGEDDIYIVTVTADRDYLDSEDRVYPVTIDPTLTWTGTTDFWDVYVCNGSAYEDINFYDSGIKCLAIGDSAQGVYRVYLRFKEITKQIKGYYVDSATITFSEMDASYKGQEVEARYVRATWNPSTITWANRPLATSKIYDSFTSSGVVATKTLDVTEHVRDIANGSISSYGLMLRATDETSTGKYVQLANSRHSTASKRPKLKVVYYDPPATPTVTIDKKYLKDGEALKVSWSGLTSKSLNRVEYRLAQWDVGSASEVRDVVAYSSATKIGTTASGSATINQNWSEGVYKFVIRGVDNGGIKGVGKGTIIYVDKTSPDFYDGVLYPKPSSNYLIDDPVLGWSVGDLYFKSVSYSVDGVTKTSTASLGSVTLELESGTHSIKLWADDLAGNVATKEFTYKKDGTAPTTGTMVLTASSKASSGYTADNNPKITVTGVTEAHSGMRTTLSGTGVKYAVVASGSTPSSYTEVPNITFTSTTSPYAYYFTVPMSGKATGTYDIYVTNTDNVGNVSTAGKTTIKRDVTAPTASMTVSSNGGVTSPTVAKTMTVDISVKDVHSGIKTAYVQLLDSTGAQVLKTLITGVTADANVSKSTNTTFDTTTLDNGSYTLKLVAEDGSGNKKDTTKTINVANQMESPTVYEKYSNDGTFDCKWEFATMPKNLKEVQYQLPDSTTWVSIANSATKTGTVSITLPKTDGIYTVKFRGVDTAGVVGKEASACCIVDTTKPTIEIESFKQGVLNGTVKDSYIQNWNVTVKQKDSTGAEEEIAKQTQNYENETLASVDLSDDTKYPADKWYVIKVTATDKAGNQSVESLSFYKGSNESVEEPSYMIEAPSGMEDEAIWELSGSEKFIIRKTDSAAEELMFDSVSWYLNGVKEADEDSVIYQGDFTDSSKYPEGKNNTILAVVKGNDGKDYLTGEISTKTYTEQVSIQETATVAEMNFSEQIYEFTFRPTESIGADASVSYKVKAEDGEWKDLEVGKTYKAADLQDAITLKDLTIQAIVNGDAKIIDYTLTYKVVKEQDFVVSLFEQYRPRNVSAQDKLDYKTHIRWELLAKDENDESLIPKQLNEVAETAEDGMSGGKIYYELYCGTEKDFTPDEDHLVTDSIETNYWSSIDVDTSEKTYYYRLRAVEKDDSGEIIRKSHFSNVAVSTGVAANEYTKRLGQQEYWGYTDFSTPNGSGAVEFSKGNFYYSQEDASLPNAQLELGLTRNYNSQSTLKTSFGTGWDHNYNLELLKLKNMATGEEEGLVFKDSTGTIYRFVKNGDSETDYHSEANEYVTLKINGDGASKTKTITITSDGKEEQRTVEYVYTMTTKDSTVYLYDQIGRLVYEEEPNGTFLTFVYDDQRGFLDTVTTEKGRTLKFVYNEETEGDCALVKQIKLPDGTTLNYEYIHEETEESSRNYRLASVTKKGTQEGESTTYTYEYDDNWMLSCILDAESNRYEIAYTSSGSDNLIKAATLTNPVGEVLELTYNLAGYKTSTTKKTPDGTELYTTSAVYNGQGYITEETDAEGITSTREYKNGVITEETTKASVHSYDASTGKVSLSVETKTQTTEYGARNNPVQETDSLGNVILYTYESQDKTDANQDLPDSETETGYDGLLLSDFDYEYDDYGNEIYSFDDITDEEIYSEYDDDGNLTSEIYYEQDDTASYSEDATGKTKVSETTYVYNDDGTVKEEVTETPESSSRTVNDYDAMGRLISSTTTYGDISEKTSTTYDYMGRDVKNTQTITKQNDSGEKETITETTSKTYDANGTLLSETAKDGTVTTYEYDALNRVVKRTVTKGELSRTFTTEYGYEKDFTIAQGGSITKTIPVAYKEVQKQGSKTVSTTYKDGAGKTVREISSGITTDYIYDSLGTQIGTVTAGKASIQVCDAAGNVTEVIENPEVKEEDGTVAYYAGTDSIVTSSRYDSRGNVTETTDGNGVTTKYTYDDEGRLSGVLTEDDKALGTYTYSSSNGVATTMLEDALGKKSITVTDAEGKDKAVIDEDSSGDNAIQTSYSYDSNGSLEKTTYADGSYLRYTYNAAGQTTEIQRYDKSGTLTERTALVLVYK